MRYGRIIIPKPALEIVLQDEENQPTMEDTIFCVILEAAEKPA